MAGRIATGEIEEKTVEKNPNALRLCAIVGGSGVIRYIIRLRAGLYSSMMQR